METPLQNVKFVSVNTLGYNKVGNLKIGSDGYCKMVIGALNMFNSANMYYDYEASKEIFEQSSELMRRVQNKSLRGELGHPRREPGMTELDYRRRLLEIRETNICCHFRSIELDFNNYKDANGNTVVAILAEVAPSGPHAHVLERAMKNKDENVCFSIRSFTHDWIEGGVIKRKIVKVSTFDMVNEPGISIANKFESPALEDKNLSVLSHGDLIILNKEITTNHQLGLEDNVLPIEDVFDKVGWSKNINTKPIKVFQSIRPTYLWR